MGKSLSWAEIWVLSKPRCAVTGEVVIVFDIICYIDYDPVVKFVMVKIIIICDIFSDANYDPALKFELSFNFRNTIYNQTPNAVSGTFWN